jgi:3-oxoacyl-[acyl-carrier-protein] synthase II
MEKGWVPPTLNFETGDHDCDLDYVTRGGRRATPRVIVSNSFGFGGINASLVLIRCV